MRPGSVLDCPTCDRTFASRLALGVHRSQAHGWRAPVPQSPVSCEECGAVFRSGKSLPGHRRLHVPLNIRFFSKVHITDGCWLWTGSRNADGYGSFWDSGKSRGAHRVAYEQMVGSIPDGLTLDHLCRVRHCVRPEHLEPVPIGENTLRGNTVNAANVLKTHCLRGHPFDEANTIRRGNSRYCRQCRTERSRASG